MAFSLKLLFLTRYSKENLFARLFACAILEISVFYFSPGHSIFSDNLVEASFECWTKELVTRQWCPLFRDGNSAPASRAQLHPSFTTICPHNGHFLRMKGQAGLGGGVGGIKGCGWGWEQHKGMTVLLRVCVIFWRAPLRDRAKACVSDTLNADYVTLYTAPPEFRGRWSFILWILWMLGLFSGRAKHGCFRLFLHTRVEWWAFILVKWKPED